MAEGLLGAGWIDLDGEPYQLARDDLVRRIAGPTARAWSVERVPLATTIIPRPDVRPGRIPGEYVITWNDWSKGISGQHDPYPGTIHYTENVDPTFPGALRMISALNSFTYTTTPMGGDPVFLARHGGIAWTLGGRLSLTLNNNSLSLDKDFGSGVIIRDGVIYDGSLLAAFGDVALANKTLANNYKMWKRTTALTGTMWTQDDHTGAVTPTGTNVNAMALHSTNNFFGDTTTNITVEIDASAPDPDTFRWNSGGAWTSGVACSTGAITLAPAGVDQGIRITFGAVNGGTIGDSWTFTCTPVPHAHHLAVVQKRLWRGISYDSAAASGAGAARAEVSNIDSGDNPEVFANWGGTVQVGDHNIPITDLTALSERVVVSKEDGLYVGDENAVFGNSLPQIENSLHPDNGKRTTIRGSSVIYPWVSGLLDYEYGYSRSAEIGLERVFQDTDITAVHPSPDVTAVCIQGNYTWVATGPSLTPRAKPTKVYLYRYNGGSPNDTYTDNTSNVTDGSLSTVLDAAALQTTDYIYVAYSASFYGVVIDLLKQNANVCTVTVEIPTALTGSNIDMASWTALPTNSTNPLSAVYDGTAQIDPYSYQTRAFRRSGPIYWGNVGTGWVNGILDASGDATARRWIRISVSAATEADVPEIAEMRVVTQPPRSYIFRGRPRGPFDRPDQEIIWESICYVDNVLPSITAMNMGTYMTMPHRRGEALLMATRNKVVIHERPVTPTDQFVVEDATARAYFSKHDGGMPEVNKQWTSITIKGSTIDATHMVSVSYRMDEATSWTVAQNNIAASPTTITLSAVTGRAMQIRLIFTDVSTYGDNATVTEVNEVEAVFRPLWTYKNVYKATLVLAEGQSAPFGGRRPRPATQLSTLEADQGAGTVTQLDPMRRSKSVTVQEVREVELLQDGTDYPALLVEVLTADV